MACSLWYRPLTFSFAPPALSDGVKSLAVLGVTGSIGRQTLEVADHLRIPVVAIGARTASEDLLEIARRYPEARVAVATEDHESAAFVEAVGKRRVEFGPAALTAMAAGKGQVVMNGIVGVAGLPVTLAAAHAGNRVALANKESMVAAGALVNEALARGGGELIPVDSEHSAIFQCLVGEEAPSKIVLTASGGPFRGKNRAQLAKVTPAEALAHPTWDMGKRITVDSATLANKALEVLEAVALFGVSLDQIEVVIHPESIVHSMVGFSDGSIKAQLGPPDMRLPIAYALTFPARGTEIIPAYDFSGVTIHFEEPDLETFPALGLGYAAGRAGGTAPAVFNAADEVAVAAFLDGHLGFLEIAAVIERTLEGAEQRRIESLEDVLAADFEGRQLALSCIHNDLR